MQSSILPPSGRKFLLDENVHAELLDFLHSKAVDAVRSGEGTKDIEIASISKAEGWIVVTNDSDFRHIPEDRIFGVVWLRIRQNNLSILLASFEKLLAECQNFEGKLILLHPNAWEDSDLNGITKKQR